MLFFRFMLNTHIVIKLLILVIQIMMLVNKLLLFFFRKAFVSVLKVIDQQLYLLLPGSF